MEDDTYNTGQAAYFLGIKEGKLYTLVKQKKIPYFRYGYALRFKRDLLIEWQAKDIKKQNDKRRKKNAYSELKAEIRKLSRSPIAKKYIIEQMQEVIKQMMILTEEEK